MAVAERAPITAEAFMDMPCDGGRYELVRGELVAVSPTHFLHGLVCAAVSGILRDYGKRTAHGYTLAGEVGVRTGRSPDSVRGADVAYYIRARLPLSPSVPKLPDIPPDLVVEVHSPGNRAGETLEKVAEYLGAGVLMVWVVHPAGRRVAIYRPLEPVPLVLGEEDVLEGFPELPDFQCSVAEFFT